MLGEAGDELGVGVGVGSAELVVEVNNGKNNTDFRAKLEQQAKQCDRIAAAGDSHAHAVSGFQESMFANVGEDGGGDGLHSNMVHLYASIWFTSLCAGAPSRARYVPDVFNSSANRPRRPRVARMGAEPRLTRATPSFSSSPMEGEPGPARMFNGP